MNGKSDHTLDNDGLTIRDLFDQKHGLTYDDIIILPGHIGFGIDAVELNTQITKKISLSVPLVSSPMDTVTESAMAINMALLGGIGIIHYNNSIDEQVAEVRKVKRFKNGFITDPLVLKAEDKVFYFSLVIRKSSNLSLKITYSLHSLQISDIDAIKAKYGFSGVPITVDGRMGSKLVGIVTTRYKILSQTLFLSLS
jgi:IMP dehydrogenase